MMHDAGVSEVVVHPRYGLEVEYLSEDWFAIFGWCVDVARKLGMRLWIYDELNWPSGTAGLRVPKIDQRFQSKFLEVSEVPVAAIDLDCFEMGEIVVAANIECGNITKTRRLEDLSALSGLTGDWKIFDCRLGFDEYYVDTMNTDAVDCFKRLTYDEYKRRFGEEFGKTIVAVFTDEPSVYWASAGYDDRRIPYTYDLFETFEAGYGYDATPFIPNLFYPGPNRWLSEQTSGNTWVGYSPIAITQTSAAGAAETGSHTPGTTTTRNHSSIRYASRPTLRLRCAKWTSRESTIFSSKPWATTGYQ